MVFAYKPVCELPTGIAEITVMVVLPENDMFSCITYSLRVTQKNQCLHNWFLKIQYTQYFGGTIAILHLHCKLAQKTPSRDSENFFFVNWRAQRKVDIVAENIFINFRLLMQKHFFW